MNYRRRRKKKLEGNPSIDWLIDSNKRAATVRDMTTIIIFITTIIIMIIDIVYYAVSTRSRSKGSTQSHPSAVFQTQQVVLELKVLNEALYAAAAASNIVTTTTTATSSSTVAPRRRLPLGRGSEPVTRSAGYLLCTTLDLFTSISDRL